MGTPADSNKSQHKEIVTAMHRLVCDKLCLCCKSSNNGNITICKTTDVILALILCGESRKS